jgi:tetratricopeptide (TPR) repeat protein
MGSRFFDEGKIELARRCYLKAQLVQDNYRKLHLAIGFIFREEEELDGALVYFRRACELDPQHRSDLYDLGQKSILMGCPVKASQCMTCSLKASYGVGDYSGQKVKDAEIILKTFEAKSKTVDYAVDCFRRGLVP